MQVHGHPAFPATLAPVTATQSAKMFFAAAENSRAAASFHRSMRTAFTPPTGANMRGSGRCNDLTPACSAVAEPQLVVQEKDALCCSHTANRDADVCACCRWQTNICLLRLEGLISKNVVDVLYPDVVPRVSRPAAVAANGGHFAMQVSRCSVLVWCPGVKATAHAMLTAQRDSQVPGRRQLAVE